MLLMGKEDGTYNIGAGKRTIVNELAEVIIRLKIPNGSNQNGPPDSGALFIDAAGTGV